MLGQARRRRREQRARVLVLVQLQHERRADHLALVVARCPGALHPASPVVDGALEEALRRLLEPGLERLAPGQNQVMVAFDQERPLLLDVAERHVRRQAHGCGQVGELDVVAGPPRAGDGLAVVVHRAAADDGARLALQRAQDADEHQRLESAGRTARSAARSRAARSSRRARRTIVRRTFVFSTYSCVDLGGADALDDEGAAALPVEQRPEHEARVGSRPAEPFDRASVEEGAERAVADDPKAARHVRLQSTTHVRERRVGRVQNDRAGPDCRRRGRRLQPFARAPRHRGHGVPASSRPPVGSCRRSARSRVSVPGSAGPGLRCHRAAPARFGARSSETGCTPCSSTRTRSRTSTAASATTRSGRCSTTSSIDCASPRRRGSATST